MRLFLLLCLMVLVSCDKKEKEQGPDQVVLKPTAFSDIPGWQDDKFAEVYPAFARSCERILKTAPDKTFGLLPRAATYAAWQPACQAFLKLDAADSSKIKEFFEANFEPYAIFANDNPQGLFTGYYEASLRGSRVKNDLYAHPLYTRPDDLVMVDLGQFREELRGQRIAGRVENGNLKPYEDRSQIVTGNWPHNDKVLVWVDDAADAFFVQIQGSGVVTFEDGSTMHIGYAGQNGHPYTAIGKELIARGALKAEDVSMQSIRVWLNLHPEERDSVMNMNKSYVFFQEFKGDGPMGGEGVALTPQRSLAIDRSLIPYGVPLWVNIDRPVADAPDIKRLMIAQDTGGAIRGIVRGDFFWGSGKDAELYAGKMKSKGQYWILLPIEKSPKFQHKPLQIQ